MSENVKAYSNICSKIGYAMLIFYAFFTLSAFGVAFLVQCRSRLSGNLLRM